MHESGNSVEYGIVHYMHVHMYMRMQHMLTRLCRSLATTQTLSGNISSNIIIYSVTLVLVFISGNI